MAKIVLIVDDDVALCKLIAKTLREVGYQCLLAYSGEEALTRYRTAQPALILMDIAMPGMTGWDTTNAIRAEEAASGQHTPIIIMSAHARMFDVATEMQKQIDGYIAKPATSEQFIAAVTQWLGAPDLPTSQPDPSA